MHQSLFPADKGDKFNLRHFKAEACHTEKKNDLVQLPGPAFDIQFFSNP